MWIEIPNQEKVISRYGAEAQTMIHMEECAELIQAASKMRRSIHSGEDLTQARYNLVEEMADVLICIMQMKQIYQISDHDIQMMVDRKCRRQEQRL